VRQILERRLGTVSPADCRARIAEYLWERKVVQPADGSTSRRPTRRAPRRVDRKLRWALPALGSAAIVLLAVVLQLAGVFSGAESGESEPAAAAPAGAERLATASLTSNLPSAAAADAIEEPMLDPVPPRTGAVDDLTAQTSPQVEEQPVSVVTPAAEPASVRFVVYPWAQVRIGDDVVFHTPRAEPVRLEAGRHQLVFEHPTFGRAEYDLELAAGEQRVVRHTFEEAPRS
jgi:hypothetical protein